MKKILRIFLIETFTLYVASNIASGIVLESGTETLIYAGIGLTLSTLIIKPVINLLLLPINLITFGLFRWVSSAVALFLVTLIIPGFKIVGFSYAGSSGGFLDMPAVSFEGVIAFIAFSFILSTITGLVYWIIS